MPVKTEHIIKIRGNEFILFKGLLDAAHEKSKDCMSIETALVAEFCDPQKDRWVVQAIGTFTDEHGSRVWSAYGDADPGNSQMKGAYLRHAETRACARMLRLYTNIGMTAAEELGHEETTPEPSIQRPARPNGPVRHEVPAGQAMTAKPAPKPEPTRTADATAARGASGWEGDSHKCSAAGCELAIAHNTEIYSLQKFKRPLCLQHCKEAEQARAAA